MEGSDRWNNIVTSISSAISTSVCKEMSRISYDFVRISGNTPRPGLTAGSLAAWFEGPPLTFITQGQSCLKICPQKKIVWGRNNFLLLWVFPNSIMYSIVYLADLFGINFLRVLVLVNNIINWTVGSIFEYALVRLSYLTVICRKGWKTVLKNEICSSISRNEKQKDH